MHLEALNEKGKAIYPYLKNFQDFYLAGGTALALQMGHRISVDFDFFSDKHIPKDLLDKIKQIFTNRKIEVSVNNKEELTVFIDDTKITFLYYPFPTISSFAEYDNVTMLDIKEIAATKAYAIGRRGTLRDYVDLYFILKDGHSTIEKIIETARKKYNNEFNSRLFLEQLIYLNDIEEENIIFLKTFVDKKELGKFFINEVKKFKL